MTNWTDISDTVLEPGKPARSIDVLALRDNTQFVKDTHGYQVFTSSGTFTAPAGITSFRLIMIGGGGGGGGTGYHNITDTPRFGGSGGSGGAIETVVSNKTSVSYVITVGAGGSANNAGSASTAFGLSVGGGGGGTNATTLANGATGANGTTPAAMIRGTAITPRFNFGYGLGGAGGSSNNGAAGKAGIVIIEW